MDDSDAIQPEPVSAGTQASALMPVLPGLTVGEAGESAVLQRVLSRLSAADAATLGPGDDCAVMRVNGELVVTSDTMIEGPDFRLDWHTGYELGWKLAATNLSDVASMGAVPTGLTVSLACPRDTPVVLLEEIASGLDVACRTLAPGCAVVGGDLASGPVLIAAVTAFGELAGEEPVTRSAAKPGDTVAYAGELGLSGLGLSLLYRDARGAEHSGAGQTGAVQTGAAQTGTASNVAREVATLWQQHAGALAAHLAPTPPIPLGMVAALAGATAMMDVSDSLSLDAQRLGAASEVAIEFSSAKLLAGFEEQLGEQVSLDLMLTGGEDHGLLATFPANVRLPLGFVEIGRVISGPATNREDSTTEATRVYLDGESFAPRGWDVFTERQA